MVQIILMGLLSWIGQNFLPWWIVSVCVAMVSFLFKSRKLMSFLSGFISGAVLWTFSALYLDIKSSSVLSKKIFELLNFSSPVYLFLVTGFIGGVLGGLGGLFGQILRILVRKK